MKVRKLQIRNLAGYQCVNWDGIQPDLNCLLGRNGSGKSTILQALSCALQFKAGVRSEDLLTRTYAEGEISLEMSPGPVTWHLRLADILTSQTAPKPEYPLHILESVENRQPKNRIGKLHNDPRQHPMYRYTNALSTLKSLLSSPIESESRLGKWVFEICKSLPALGATDEWDWIEQALKQRSQLRARPTSCGQFDILAFVLDLCRFKQSIVDKTAAAFIILDNPETYLHPSCQEPIVNLVQQLVPEAQLFMASHSLKLLCRREPKQVFWLRRKDIGPSGSVAIRSIRETDDGGKAAFFELYGDDLSSAVLDLVRTYDSPEYYRFLTESALPSMEIARKRPMEDRQIATIRDELDWSGANQWTILDYGAGSGDLLVGLAAARQTDLKPTYFAYSRTISDLLINRLKEAIDDGVVSSSSRIVQNIAEVPEGCDVIVLCNVCHEILPPELPSLISRLLFHNLARTGSERIVIHEVETLAVGERDFIMWTPEDYATILSVIPGLDVKLKSASSSGNLPLNTTIISYSPPQEMSLADLEAQLIGAFDDYLEVKKTKCLDEIELGLSMNVDHRQKLANVVKQRRHAFLVAQLATVCLLQRRRRLI